MKHHYPEIPLLFEKGLVTSPLAIRASTGVNIVEASLLSDGRITMNGVSYPSIYDAMLALRPLPESTSTPWQFWAFYSGEREAWTPLEHLRAKVVAIEEVGCPVKTSISHPLRVDALDVPNCSGRIGLTFCPGKCTDGLYGGAWERDLTMDLEVIRDWGASVLISLMEMHEFAFLGVPAFTDIVSQKEGITWLHLPIKDMQIPDADFESRWQSIAPILKRRLMAGESVVIHCRGGLGRTGLLAARMLVEFGVMPVDAVARVRLARKRSIETYRQEYYVLTKEWQEQ